MAAKVVHKSYVIFSWSQFGLKMYLSHLGYYINNQYRYVWEPGFENARHFDTKPEALYHAKRAAIMLPSHSQYSIVSYTVKDNNTTKLKEVYTGGVQ